MLQRREADLFLGDIAISRERRSAVEFSFFTLADSGAFATHSPGILNEALALIRPFQWNVWPLLLLTFIVVGPILYFIIILPIKWNLVELKARKIKPKFHIEYLRELSYGCRLNPERSSTAGLFEKCVWFTTSVFLKQSIDYNCFYRKFNFLFDFDLSGSILPFNSNRVRFVTIVLWLSGTYVIGDLYSAQLTSQLAKPAREQPIS